MNHKRNATWAEGEPTNEARARRIVQAVNAFDDLLEACKELAPILGKLAVKGGEVFPCDDYNRKRFLLPGEAESLINGSLKLRAAIRKAGQE